MCFNMRGMKYVLVATSLSLSACSYFFPDKEKDYLYSQSIADLEVPPHQSAITTERFIEPFNRSEASAYRVEKKSAAETIFLEFNSSFAHVWRVVGKALTRESLEITDRNRLQATYYIQYDPMLKEVADGSYWAEFLFLFADDVHQEQPYQIVLKEIPQGTQLFIKDEQGKILSSGKGKQLLELLFSTIKEDFAD